MEPSTNRFEAAPGAVSGFQSRRLLLRRLVGSGLGFWGVRLTAPAGARRRSKRKKNAGKGARCTRNGARCTRRGAACRERNCLRAPFTIEANWTESASAHDTFLFVPPRDGAIGPAPYISYACNQTNSACEEAYPFACVSQDAEGPGNEVTTVYRLLRGRYEYWIEIYESTPAAELTVVLNGSGGQVLREWTNPANVMDGDVGWHVFDVDAEGRVTSIDELIDVNLPRGAHNPSTNVCPRPAARL